MTAPRPPRDGERGAAALLFVALVVAVAIATAASLIMGRAQFAVQQNAGTSFDLTALRKAVEAHAMTLANPKVTCPSSVLSDTATGLAVTSCNPGDAGVLPWRTIGVAERQAKDAWGQRVLLVYGGGPTRRLKSSRTGTHSGCHFILISGGADLAVDADLGKVTIDIRNPAPGSDEDLDLAVCGRLPANSSLIAENFTMTEDGTQHIKPRFKSAPHPEWAETDEVMSFGGSDNRKDTYDVSPSNVSKTACAWYNEPFAFTSGTLRGYLRFQFLPGETLPTQTQNTGQGFALMVIPGTRMMEAPLDGQSPTAECGTASPDNAYGFKGVPRPKLAMEFDIYRDTYEGQNDYSGGRNNPKPEGNHVALLNPVSQDYISHGGYGNPPCYNRSGGETGPAMNGDNGACTYPPADAAERPARHAVRPAHWLEDGRYDDDVLHRPAAQPYQVRFEITRRCNSDCSECGFPLVRDGETVEDEDDLNDAFNSIRAKVWIACDEILEGNPNNCPNLPPKFQRLDEAYSGTTEYMINYCMPDRSFNYAEDFTTVKLGIGFSTRNSAVGLLLHRFEAMSSESE